MRVLMVIIVVDYLQNMVLQTIICTFTKCKVVGNAVTKWWLRQNNGRFEHQRNEIFSDWHISRYGAPHLTFVLVIASYFA